MGRKISLQSSASAVSSFVFTLDSTTSSADGVIAVVEIGDSDLDLLKLDSAVWDSGVTFLSFADAAIQDTNGNPSPARQRQSTTVVLDTTPPTLELFDLDMNTGVLRMSFSEVMNITSLKRELFKLLGASSAD